MYQEHRLTITYYLMSNYRHAPIIFLAGFGGFVFWLNTNSYISDLSDNFLRVTPDLLSLTYVVTNVFVRLLYLYLVGVSSTLLGDFFDQQLGVVEVSISGRRAKHGSGSSSTGSWMVLAHMSCADLVHHLFGTKFGTVSPCIQSHSHREAVFDYQDLTD